MSLLPQIREARAMRERRLMVAWIVLTGRDPRFDSERYLAWKATLR